ncbi:hypothetical protein Fmac_024883 [Flemingia macrophylla]|uniref:Uncharacterized protein n=1 Tax=Flemingia macrophylla TaxID=520843 RepID=A0ABD1LQN6_9FABA
MSILRLMLLASIVGHHKQRGRTLDREDGFQLLAVSVQEMMPLSLEEFTMWQQIHLLKLESFGARNDAILIRGLHDVATDTSAETKMVEDTLVNLQPGVNEHPEAYAANIYSRNDAIVIRGGHGVATDTFTDTRKVESKLDALVKLVTLLAVNQKLASIAIVCGIRSSNDHHTNACHHSSRGQTLDREMASNSKKFQSARNDTIVVRGVHDVATDASTETRKVEGKLDALVNLVTQLAVNQKSASIARVCHHNSRGHTLDREDDFNLLAVSVQEMMSLSLEEFTTWLQIYLRKLERWKASLMLLGTCARNDAIVIKGVHDVATDTSAETRMVEGKLDAFVILVEGKLDALVNLVTQLAMNRTLPLLQEFVASVLPMTAIQMPLLLRVHEVATDTSAKTRKVEGKLDALVNLVTQLAVNQKPASIARVCHHSSRSQTLYREDGFQLLVVSVQEMMPFSFEEFTTWLHIHLLKLESWKAGVHDVATDTSTETRKVKGKLYALVNLVTQLAVNQKPASVARVCGIRSSSHDNSRGQTLDREDGFQLLAVSVQQMIKVEDKLDALVNFVTQLAVNQKHASVARVCGIHSSNDHHTNVCPSFFRARNDAIVIRGVDDVATDIHLLKLESEEGKLDALVNLCSLGVNRSLHLLQESVASILPMTTIQLFGARNDAIVIRGVYDVATDTYAETRKVKGKLDALVNFVTQLAQPGVNERPEAYAANNYSRPPQAVHDVATNTSIETKKVEGKLDALVNLVTQLAVNQKPASVARVCGIRSSNDYHTNICPSSWQPEMNEHPEAYAINT